MSLRNWSFVDVLLASAAWAVVAVLAIFGVAYFKLRSLMRQMQMSESGGGAVSTGLNVVWLVGLPPILLLAAWWLSR